MALFQAQKKTSREDACERINPEYYFHVTTPSLCRRYTLYRFRWGRDSARFADARTSCDPIAGAFSSGPSCYLFYCGRSAAASAAPGTQASSSVQDESRIQKLSPQEKFISERARLRAWMSFVVNLEKLANGGMRVTLRRGKRRMAEQFLNGSQVRSVGEQMRGKSMPQ
jgi:hypothetical protein